jgi:hypothetical protein
VLLSAARGGWDTGGPPLHIFTVVRRVIWRARTRIGSATYSAILVLLGSAATRSTSITQYSVSWQVVGLRGTRQILDLGIVARWHLLVIADYRPSPRTRATPPRMCCSRTSTSCIMVMGAFSAYDAKSVGVTFRRCRAWDQILGNQGRGKPSSDGGDGPCNFVSSPTARGTRFEATTYYNVSNNLIWNCGHDGGAGVQQGGFRGAQANSQRIPLVAEMTRWRAPKEAVIEDGVIVWAHGLEQRDQVAPLTRSNKPTGIKRLLRHASFA